MTDLINSLANLNGQKEALAMAKGLVDGVAASLALGQIEASQKIAGVVAQLQGVAGYRVTSDTDERLLAERLAGQSAAIDYIKANPECTVEDAIAAWVVAAKTVRPDRTLLLQDPAGILEEYQGNMGMGSWEEFRAAVVETEKSVLMNL